MINRVFGKAGSSALQVFSGAAEGVSSKCSRFANGTYVDAEVRQQDLDKDIEEADER